MSRLKAAAKRKAKAEDELEINRSVQFSAEGSATVTVCRVCDRTELLLEFYEPNRSGRCSSPTLEIGKDGKPFERWPGDLYLPIDGAERLVAVLLRAIQEARSAVPFYEQPMGYKPIMSDVIAEKVGADTYLDLPRIAKLMQGNKRRSVTDAGRHKMGAK